ncbi:hypothetical protein RclHR1_32220002 [Rhizophagus clarus]|uniref:Uncharacterized protein n=1 Tax=Rhizophagus clarus TaxID=94130 RepID=A0A2Z6R866_9GLOM|nr:hypothetical protein RclHR1_32220002 [Rhizophagus clarus]
MEMIGKVDFSIFIYKDKTDLQNHLGVLRKHKCRATLRRQPDTDFRRAHIREGDECGHEPQIPTCRGALTALASGKNNII